MAEEGVPGIAAWQDRRNRRGDGGSSGQPPSGQPRRRLADYFPAPSNETVDQFGVAALPPGSIPPAIEKALSTLTAEVERLRSDLNRAHGHESRLEETADRDPLLPVLNRRAFTREFAHLIDRVTRADLSGCVVWIHLGGLAGLRRRIGLTAADAALVRAADLVRAQLDPAEPLGYFGEGDFAAAMVLEGVTEAVWRAKRIEDALVNAPWPSGYGDGLEPLTGVAVIASDISPDRLLAAAEAKSREPGF